MKHVIEEIAKRDAMHIHQIFVHTQYLIITRVAKLERVISETC